jgi:uncharacterized protein YggE
LLPFHIGEFAMSYISYFRKVISITTLVCGIALPQAANANQKTLVELTQSNRTITTHGDYQVKVHPNKITVVFTIKTFDAVVPDAYSSNSQSAQSLIALAPKLNIAKTDVQTSALEMKPEYYYGNQYYYGHPLTAESYKPLGYTVSRTVAFVIKDVDKLATVLSSGLQNGANGVQSVSYECSDAPKYRSQARLEALKAAREKAQALAVAAGCKIGRPTNITEGYSDSGTYIASSFSLQGATNGTIGPQGSDATYVSNSSQGYSLGELTISSDVTATFELQ